MSDPEDDVIKQLISLSRYGTMEDARLEAVRSLASYRHHPAALQQLINLSAHGTMEPIRIAAIRALGGRSLDDE